MRSAWQLYGKLELLDPASPSCTSKYLVKVGVMQAEMRGARGRLAGGQARGGGGCWRSRCEVGVVGVQGSMEVA